MAAPIRRSSAGLGQLTLVEHALCPLDTGQSLRENLVFETGYFYADKNRHQKKAAAATGAVGSEQTGGGGHRFDD